MDAIRYPSREEATQHRQDVHEAVKAVRTGALPDKEALAWPAGLDRRLLGALPVQNAARLALARNEAFEGEDPLTVKELLDTPYVTAEGVRDGGIRR